MNLLRFPLLFVFALAASIPAAAQQGEFESAVNSCRGALVAAVCKGYAERALTMGEIESVPSVHEALQKSVDELKNVMRGYKARNASVPYRSWLFVGQSKKFQDTGWSAMDSYLADNQDPESALSHYIDMCLADDTALFETTYGYIGDTCTDMYSKWVVYENARFGFSVEYPAYLLKDLAPPTNGSGVSLLSFNRAVSLTAFGSFNVADEPDIESLRSEILGFDDYSELTYNRLKDNWFVLSGFRGENIYYEKYILTCNNRVINAIVFTYPKAEVDRFSDMTEQIADSLTPGFGFDNPEEDCQ